MNNLPDLDALSFDAVIPSALLFNENLEPNAIKLYAFVRGLTRAHGYCFATNEYLAHCMRSDISSVKRWLTSLKQEKFIDIQTEKDGIHWQRRIFVGVNFNNCLRRLKNKPPPAQNCTPPSSKLSHIYKEGIKYEILDEEREEAAPPPPPPSFFSEGNVRMPLKRKEELEKEFGIEKVKQMIGELNDYSEIKPAEFKKYGSHAAVIRKWIKREEKENKTSSEGGSVDRNREFALSVATKYSHLQIEAGSESIGFLAGNYPFYINYKEHGFKDQVIGRLRKMGLTVTGLI